MERIIYTYALIKVLFDQKRDFIDSFIPLILSTLLENSIIDLKSIQQKLIEEFELSIPIHVLKTIVKRAKRRGYLEEDLTGWHFTREGFDHIKSLEERGTVQRRINALVESAQIFFKSRDELLTTEAIKRLLYNFIRIELYSLIKFLDPTTDNEITIDRSREGKETRAILVEFILEIQEKRPAEFQILKELVYGGIIAATLHKENLTEQKSFDRISVYLDSNFIFNLLYGSDETKKAAQELVDIIKQEGLTLRIFDFTVEEMCSVIENYPRISKQYPSGIQIDSIYSTLRRAKWTFSDAKDFVVNVDTILGNLGVDIVQTNRGEELESYVSTNQSLTDAVMRYKPAQSLIARNRDLITIEEIKKIRKKSSRNIEDVNAIFLTCDNGLHSADIFGDSHREKGTIGEVILDSLFASILWIKNPGIDLPVDVIIASHSRDLLIDRRVWDKFYTIINTLKERGDINNDQVAALFYHGYLNEFLRKFDSSDADNITEGVVLDRVEKAAKIAEYETEQDKQEKEKLRIELEKAESEKEKILKMHDRQVSKIRASAQKDANREADRISWLIFILTALSLGFVEYVLYVNYYKDIPVELKGFIDFQLSKPALGLFQLAIFLKGRKLIKDRLAKKFQEKKIEALI